MADGYRGPVPLKKERGCEGSRAILEGPRMRGQRQRGQAGAVSGQTSSQMSNGFHLAGITRSPGLTIPSRTRAIDSIVLGSDCARAISIWSAALMRRDAFTSDVTR